MYAASRSIGQVANYKPLRLCNIEELAATQITRPSGGMLFARNPDRAEKDAARKLILNLFRTDLWGHDLRILTMPGLDWRFERKLLGKREGNWMGRKAKLDAPRRTQITSIENDRFIYYSACHQMPGLHTHRALTKILPAPSFGERTVSTGFIKAFHFANVDDLMRETDETWDAVWLDYIGPLTTDRLALIAAFYQRAVSSTIVVTALKARWNRATSDAITRAGGHSKWLRSHLTGHVLHDIEYFDTSPMAQIAVCKTDAAISRASR